MRTKDIVQRDVINGYIRTETNRQTGQRHRRQESDKLRGQDVDENQRDCSSPGP